MEVSPAVAPFAHETGNLQGPFSVYAPEADYKTFSYAHTTTVFAADVNPSPVKPGPITQSSLHGVGEKETTYFSLGTKGCCSAEAPRCC